jgi:uncharacterized protein YPO0396
MADENKEKEGQGNEPEEKKEGEGQPENKPAGEQPPAESTKLTAEQQAEIDKQVKAQLAQVKADTEKATREKLTADAEADAKKKQGQFESLYNDEKAKAEVLETKVTELEDKVKKLNAIVEGELKEKKKALPKELIELMPEYDDVTKQLDWLRKAQEKAIAGMGFMKGNPQFGGGSDKEAYEQAVQTRLGTGVYEN